MKKIVFRLLFWVSWPLVWFYAPLRTRARVLVVCGDEFLAVRAYFGSGSWQLPGGGVRFGEQASNAAVRELNEEVSIIVDQVKLLVPVATYKESGLLMRYVVFVCILDKKPTINNNSEIAESAWLLIDNSFKLSPHIQSALTANSRG